MAYLDTSGELTFQNIVGAVLVDYPTETCQQQSKKQPNKKKLEKVKFCKTPADKMFEKGPQNWGRVVLLGLIFGGY